MKHFAKILVFTTLIALFLFFSADQSFAQCPMCKAAAEANLKEGGTHGLGLNTGILYLFLTPYFLVGSIGLIWWWRNRSAKLEETLEV